MKKEVIKNSSSIITVSEFSKSEIVEDWLAKEDDVFVTRNSTGQGKKRLNQNDRFKTLSKYGFKFEEEFLFYLGGFDSRKNVKRLIETYRTYIAPLKQVNLVIGGKISDEKIFELMDGKRMKEVKFVGEINERDLDAFYQTCKAFITFTEYEGFNLPLLDALKNKCVCICANIEANKELASEFAVYLNLKNSDISLSKSIIQATSGENYVKIKEQSKLFSFEQTWKKMAEQTAEIYVKTLKKNGK